MWPRTDGHADRQTRVTTIHFASSTTHAKCNQRASALSLVVCLCGGADGPHIVCESLDVRLGQRNVCLRCHVTARPAPSSVHWQLNDSDVIADDAHWAVVQVWPNFCRNLTPNPGWTAARTLRGPDVLLLRSLSSPAVQLASDGSDYSCRSLRI